MDDELIRDFITETNESLATLDNQLLELETNSNDQVLINNIFRLLHTIKGTCGFLGLGKLEKVAHSGENVLGKIREGKLAANSDIVSIILEVIDTIKLIVQHIESEGSEPKTEYGDLIVRLDAIYNGEEIKTEAKETKQAEPVNQEVANVEEVKPTNNNTNVGEKKTNNQTIRINLEVVEKLMQDISELVLARNQLIQMNRDNDINGQKQTIQRINYITSDLQETVMQTRMQNVGSIWLQIPRMIRDLSKELGKKIEFEMSGEDTEVDRQLLEFIKDPLMHMIRNAADHGLETPEERIKQNKDPKGKIKLAAYHQGGQIVIEISDDGKGLSVTKIKEKVLAKKLSTTDELEKMTHSQIQNFIFAAGFSTAEKVTAVSGRGVGMDVVKTNIEKINGTIELDSVEGKGSTFKIRIPLTLAIMPVLIVRSGDCLYGLPQANIIEIVKLSNISEHKLEYINNNPVLKIRNQLLSLVSLPECLGEKAADAASKYIAVCEVNKVNFGIMVDGICDSEEIVVKPVAEILRNQTLYSGCTILGDGSVTMIIDTSSLLKFLKTEQNENENAFQRIAVQVPKSHLASLLIFRVAEKTPKAVPLEVVLRLEEIDLSGLEYSDGKPVIQYNNKLMHILDIEDRAIPKDIMNVIVFHDRDSFLGVIVDEVIDIIEHDMSDINHIENEAFLGSTIINGRTVDLINMSYYFKRFLPQKKENEVVKMSPKGKIMLIDDSPFFRKFIPPALMEKGYQVQALEDARIALENLEKGQDIDLIITDINMPFMNGEEFAFTVSNDHRFSNIPIIALTSNANDNLKNHPEMLGFWAHVTKTNHHELLDTVDKLMIEAKK